ncbi:hypothetical protein A3I40_02430 [Candidatus Uhrbacteria bacterium RIFCSPLOWO2_02_FULL_48_12]|uniref:PsbP C-terminal domain-containing protein n=1 Tax=Candidatus Uhrbacteria bacterium RIFCSPLOWO2_02_FULL_48_12 TaxID=1802407 RepID=A0A1F7V5Q4_9BACT|nr:MAG: hypothetical protein A3I40_02430 [Candidatus Uhrbacteria bacterium RIFCSPLOWO2_02_FULL_48_12]
MPLLHHKPLDKKGISYLIVIAFVAIMAGATMWSLSYSPAVWHLIDTNIARRTVSAATDRTFQNDLYNFTLVVPKGWYLHERPDGSAIFTKKERLTISKETEGWAIGEQINVSVAALEDAYGKKITPEKWAAKNIPEKDADDKPITTTWESTEDSKLLRVEREAAGTSNKVLYYYVFHGNNIFSFGLYPYSSDNTGNNSDFEEMVRSLSFNTNPSSIKPN